MISLVDGQRAILRMAERAIREVWVVQLGGPPEDGALRMEGVEEPETFRGDFYTRSSIVLPDDEHMQKLAGIGLIDDSTAARYRYIGNLHVQVFGKKSVAGSLFKAKDIADAIKKKFVGRRDRETGIEFMAVRLKNESTEKQWYHVRTVADFQFDEVLSVAG